jgi:hypothetical protein
MADGRWLRERHEVLAIYAGTAVRAARLRKVVGTWETFGPVQTSDGRWGITVSLPPHYCFGDGLASNDVLEVVRELLEGGAYEVWHAGPDCDDRDMRTAAGWPVTEASMTTDTWASLPQAEVHDVLDPRLTPRFPDPGAMPFTDDP